MLKLYYNLAKPGLVYGNLLTAIAAYLYASRWHLASWPALSSLLAMVVGLGLVVASACVFNNYIDSDIDGKMDRTKDRATVSGAVSKEHALLFGITLGVLGFAILIAFVNAVATVVAGVGFLLYVFAYTFSKRTTAWATEIGSLAGAAPIVVGYSAAADRLDSVALILFVTLALWQMPHFFAIAIRRARDYASAGIPTLPLQKGTYRTKLQILIYIVGFSMAAAFLTLLGYAGYLYVVLTEISALAWFALAGQGFRAENDEAWAKRLFFASLAVLLVFCIALALASVLP